MSRRLLAFIAMLTIVGAGSATGCTGSGDDAYSAKQLRTGEEVSVTSLKGKPAMLVSWATWCRNCDEELARLQEFESSEASDGISVVAVNLDAASVEDEIDAKIERHGLTVELWRDQTNDFKRHFGALGVPTTVLLDVNGDVVQSFPGVVDFDDPEVAAALKKANGA